MDAATGLWNDIGKQAALIKIRQALREGAPSLLKELKDVDSTADGGARAQDINVDDDPQVRLNVYKMPNPPSNDIPLSSREQLRLMSDFSISSSSSGMLPAEEDNITSEYDERKPAHVKRDEKHTSCGSKSGTPESNKKSVSDLNTQAKSIRDLEPDKTDPSKEYQSACNNSEGSPESLLSLPVLPVPRKRTVNQTQTTTIPNQVRFMTEGGICISDTVAPRNAGVNSNAMFMSALQGAPHQHTAQHIGRAEMNPSIAIAAPSVTQRQLFASNNNVSGIQNTYDQAIGQFSSNLRAATFQNTPATQATDGIYNDVNVTVSNTPASSASTYSGYSGLAGSVNDSSAQQLMIPDTSNVTAQSNMYSSQIAQQRRYSNQTELITANTNSNLEQPQREYILANDVNIHQQLLQLRRFLGNRTEQQAQGASDAMEQPSIGNHTEENRSKEL